MDNETGLDVEEDDGADPILLAVGEIAREQHSTISWAQMLAVGASPNWISRRRAQGVLDRVGPRTYRFSGVRRDFENRAIGVVLQGRGPAVISHRSAAYLHGLEGVGTPGFVDVTVPRHHRPKRRSGVTVHETLDVELLAPVIRNRIPVTGRRPDDPRLLRDRRPADPAP